jgi:hypothetical protein
MLFLFQLWLPIQIYLQTQSESILSPSVIQKTLSIKPKMLVYLLGALIKRTFKSPNPALNVTWRNESVACNILYTNTPPAHDL